MIEEYIGTIIEELGSTGLLLIGLYFIMMRMGKMLSTHLWAINHNTTSIAEYLRILAEQKLKENNGEGGRRATHTG